MVSRNARREADLFWRDLVRGSHPRGSTAFALRTRTDFLDSLLGRPMPLEDVAEAGLKVPRELPTLTAAITAGTALFELIPWYVEWKDPADSTKSMFGFFWMFSDALMWEAPKSGTWATWAGTTPHPLPRAPFGGVKITNRTRLVRLPCTGKEATAATDLLKFSQADLRMSAGGEVAGPADGNDSKIESLLPTPELYDRMFFQADVRITAVPGSVSNLTDINKDSLAYAERVNTAFEKAKTTVVGGTRNSLGVPGKIWAIADRMDTWVCCSQWEVACINYGMHKTMSWVKGKPVVTDIWQDPGGCHPWVHEDYSQIFTLVAGWCWVKGLDDTAASWKKTADVYMDKTLCKLVRNNGPAPALRYRGTASTPKPTTPCVAKSRSLSRKT